jgi:SAM-dependent methyltransferase
LNGLPENRCIVSAGEDLPFSADSFDLVYCLSVIEHVSSVEKTMNEVLRVLKPGGVFYLVAPNYLNFYESHYKIFWLPKFPKPLARQYLKMRGRPADFLDTLNYITPGWLFRLLKRHSVSIKRFPQGMSDGLSRKQRILIRLREKIGLGHIEWAVTKTAGGERRKSRP